MKIGRNDPCPCGSGKKYKNCCLRKETMSIPDRIREAVRERGYKEDIGDVLSSMYRYICIRFHALRIVPKLKCLLRLVLLMFCRHLQKIVYHKY